MARLNKDVFALEGHMIGDNLIINISQLIGSLAPPFPTRGTLGYVIGHKAVYPQVTLSLSGVRHITRSTPIPCRLQPHLFAWFFALSIFLDTQTDSSSSLIYPQSYLI